jgi:hypothetical protein
MGFRQPVKRSTLADANETRNWRIYAEFAQNLIRQARRLYAKEPLEVELSTPCTLWTPPPSICASLFFLGLPFARPKQE